MKKRGLSSRIMSVLLSLMMLLSLLPTAVLADESATKTYTKVTSADELVTGEYVMVANNGYAPGVLDGTWVTAVAVTAANDQVIAIGQADFVQVVPAAALAVAIHPAAAQAPYFQAVNQQASALQLAQHVFVIGGHQ